MKRTLALLLAIFFVVNLTACTKPAPPPRTESEIVLAQEFMNHLMQGEYTQAVQMFDKVMKDKLPAKDLSAAWSQVSVQFGSPKSFGTPDTAQQGEYNIVLIPIVCESGSLKARTVFNKQKEIAGLQFVEPQIVSQYESPAYVNPAKFTERDIQVGSGEFALPGTLSIPNGVGPFPAVVLVHGSGPNDRDETIIHNKPFRDIAQGLASQGIVVLRYDKRTLVHGQKMNLTTITPHEETVEDAVLAAQVLLSLNEVDRGKVFILGHSLGGLLAPRITENLSQVRGTIILGGPTRPLEDLVVDQYTYLYNLDGELTSIEKQHLKELEAQVNRAKDPKLNPNVSSNLLPLGMPASYWLYLQDYDPVATAAASDKPMLILQGERDYQVRMVDFSGWQQITRANVITKSYETLDHLFMHAEGTGLSKPNDYQLRRNVDQQVIVDIIQWVKSHRS